MTMIPDRPAVLLEGRYSAAQTSRLLGISRETLRKCVRDGRIKRHTGRLSVRAYYLGRDILKLWRSY